MFDEVKPAARAVAKKPSVCPMCNRRILLGAAIMKDYETGWWVHPACLVIDLAKYHDAPDLPGVLAFRERVIDAVKCTKCGARVGWPCRELGRERDAVHRVRVRAAEAVSTTVLSSVA